MTWGATLKVLPGLAGDLARWIDSTLTHSQPGISIPIALSFVAALKSKRIAPLMGIPCNLYTCSIAPSGTGKSQAQSALAAIVRKTGIESLMMGKPASDSGLLRSLAENPRRLLVWDEFGIALSELANSTNSYRALILATIMDLFSSAKSNYRGKEYSQQARVDIKEPYLSIFAASTPGRFFDSLSTNFIEDGFLPRWLLFFSDVNKVEQPQRELTDIPADIEQRILALQRGRVKGTGGDIERVTEKDLKVLKIDQESLAYEKSKLEIYKGQIKEEHERVLWSRAYEQAIKICIVLTDTDEVDFKFLPLAFSLVIDSIKETIAKCAEKLSSSNSRYEKDKIKAKQDFIDLIRPGQKLSQSELTKKSFRSPLSSQEKKSLITELLEAEVWELVFESPAESRKKSKFYRAL